MTTNNADHVSEYASDQVNEQGTDRRDELLPFLSNFQDIFLTIGLLILLGGLGIFAGIWAANMSADNWQQGLRIGAMISGFFVVISWFLSAIIVGRARRILPGIVLALIFVSGVGATVGLTYASVIDVTGLQQFDPDRLEGIVENVEDGQLTDAAFRAAAAEVRDSLPHSVLVFLPLVIAVQALAAWLYYRVFRLPFSVALAALSGLMLVSTLIFFVSPYDAIKWSPTIGLVTGVVLILLAIGYDMRDPERLTRLSGNGFWLHFFAAPILLANVLTIVTTGFAYDFVALSSGDFSDFEQQFSSGQAVATLIVIGIFAVISLLLNRRALIVSGLLSAGVAIGVLVNESGLGGASVAAATLVLLGAAILLLGLGWHAARRVLLVFVPSGGFFGRVFPRTTADG